MKLDKEQQAVVDSKAEQILVVAGAGSGKTRVLTERVKKLLLDGVEPHNIVCITFTNMASQEMRERLSEVPGIGDAFIGTIHSFANRIYKESGISYELLTSDKHIFMMKDELSNGYKHLRFNRYLKYLDVKKQEEQGRYSEETLLTFLYPSERTELSKALAQVRKTCKQRNILSFNDLLTKTTEYYHKIGANIEYVLVDEFQDVGTYEADFVFGLNATNTFLVGDDWQSIYGFKGGNVEIFKRLLKDETWEVFYLSNNYRNSPEVNDLARSVITQVKDIVPKKVRLQNQIKGMVEVAAKEKLNQYLDALQQEPNLKDWFILTRTNKEAFTISRQLDTLKIPYIGFKRSQLTLEEMEKLMKQNTVKLLTVHTAKGLENRNVILYGNFPIKQLGFMTNNDERKVMYVGITRAMEKLILLN